MISESSIAPCLLVRMLVPPFSARYGVRNSVSGKALEVPRNIVGIGRIRPLLGLSQRRKVKDETRWWSEELSTGKPGPTMFR